MNKLDEYKNLISSLSEVHFKELVRIYLRAFYKTDEVNIVDGPWDGGNDACVYIDGKYIKRNIQITVQDNYVNKLKEDLIKSQRNIDNYNYQRDLLFFISHPISHSKIDELVRMAEIEYDINLKIYDANKIAGDNDRFPEIGDYVVRVFAPSIKSNNILQVNKANKILFDNIATGGNISEVKANFIDSYIQMYLYETGAKTQDEIISYIKSQLEIKTDEYIKDRIKYNVNKQNIVYNTETMLYSLTDEKNDDIRRNIELAEATGNNLLNQIDSCLQNHQIFDKELGLKLIELIVALYNSHYDSELDELNFYSNTEVRERRIYLNLKNEIGKVAKDEDCDCLTRELLDVSCKSEYLNKISASSMFAKLIKSDTLDEYLSKFTRHIYVDTQILLQMLCVKFKSVAYNDSLYNAVKYMLDVRDSLHDKIVLYTTNAYIKEAAYHMWEAHNLRRFLDYPFVKSLGESKNIFYNFYLHLCNYDYCDFENFDHFICELLQIDEELPKSKHLFIDAVENILSDIFEFLGVEIINVQTGDFDRYEMYRREYDIYLDTIHSFKTDKVRENDLLTLLYLSEKDNHLNDDTRLYDAPYFVTWDSTFYNARNIFAQKYKRSHWHLYTPYKIANRLSTMTFKLNSSHITYEFLSLVESNFKASNEAVSFIDTLSSICQYSDLGEYTTIRKLKELRLQQQNDTTLNDFLERNHNNLPIDIVLNALVNHCYRNRRMRQLGKAFENEEFSDTIKSIIIRGCESITKENRITPNIFSAIDKLLSDMA